MYDYQTITPDTRPIKAPDLATQKFPPRISKLDCFAIIFKSLQTGIISYCSISAVLEYTPQPIMLILSTLGAVARFVNVALTRYYQKKETSRFVKIMLTNQNTGQSLSINSDEPSIENIINALYTTGRYKNLVLNSLRGTDLKKCPSLKMFFTQEKYTAIRVSIAMRYVLLFFAPLVDGASAMWGSLSLFEHFAGQKIEGPPAWAAYVFAVFSAVWSIRVLVNYRLGVLDTVEKLLKVFQQIQQHQYKLFATWAIMFATIDYLALNLASTEFGLKQLDVSTRQALFLTHVSSILSVLDKQIAFIISLIASVCNTPLSLGNNAAIYGLSKNINNVRALASEHPISIGCTLILGLIAYLGQSILSFLGFKMPVAYFICGSDIDVDKCNTPMNFGDTTASLWTQVFCGVIVFGLILFQYIPAIAYDTEKLVTPFADMNEAKNNFLKSIEGNECIDITASYFADTTQRLYLRFQPNAWTMGGDKRPVIKVCGFFGVNIYNNQEPRTLIIPTSALENFAKSQTATLI